VTESVVRHRRVFLLVSLSALFLLLLPNPTGSWQRNYLHLYLFNSLAYSPYPCMVERDICDGDEASQVDGTTWQFSRELQNGLVLREINGLANTQSVAIAVPASRTPLIAFVEGALALEGDNQEDALASWRREPNIALYLAAIAGRVDNPARAAEIYDLSLALAPAVPAYLEQGKLYYQLERYLEARDTLSSGAALLESSSQTVYQRHAPHVFLHLGHTYRKLDELQLARESYEQALALNPDWDGATLGLADVSLAEGDQETASQLLEDLVERKPRSPVPHYRLAQVYLGQGDLPSARSVAEAMTENYTDYHPGWQLLGHIAFRQEDYASSLEAYRRYLLLEPNDAGIEQRMSELQELLGGN
jgi:tetratricopeptide (TPR) repeat protein